MISSADDQEVIPPFQDAFQQNYSEIKKKCLENNILFEDPVYPATSGSLFFSKDAPDIHKSFEWKRPSEICDNPQFITDGASRFDVKQGMLGDSWLLAATASLTINQKLYARVVPTDQNFTVDYCGVFRFHFWHEGNWMEVVVDDRLPVYKDRVVFMHSAEKNEFWSALLEKAYAKLMGSYESLKGGSTCEAMEDFTGGVTEMFDLRKAPDNLLTIMMKASDRGSLMGCSIDVDKKDDSCFKLDNGLVKGHAYSVTAVKQMEFSTLGRTPMIRVRNPWGNEREWTGCWSDNSIEWRRIPENEKQDLGLIFEDDGEFWMSFSDWKDNFHTLEICNLSPDSLEEDEGKQWKVTSISGEWIPRVNAGGCKNYIDTFWTYPQYKVTLVDPDDDEDDLCTLVVGVLQKDRRRKRKEMDEETRLAKDQKKANANEKRREEEEEEKVLKTFFGRVAGEDTEIDANELIKILNAAFKRDFKTLGFDIDCCHSMVALCDNSLSGKLTYDEFKNLWYDLRKWKDVFKEKDVDQTGSLNSNELRQALHGCGFTLSNRSLGVLVTKYCNDEGLIELVDFIAAAVKLKTMLNTAGTSESNVDDTKANVTKKPAFAKGGYSE